MDINIKAFVSGITLAASAIENIKKLLDLLPDGSRKADAIATLKRAEEEFKTAQGEAALSLGYELCKKHWPAEIMLSTGEPGHWRCPECGNEITPTALPDPDQLAFPKPRSQWTP